ncbi:MAG: class II fructose-bisphosphate aldolase [Candidatus Limnocylindrales bacterium]
MSPPTVATSAPDLLQRLAGTVRLDAGQLIIEDEAALRGRGIRDLAWTATFSEAQDAIAAARWIVWAAAQTLGCSSASIHELYMARGRGEVGGFTVPAINLRTQVFDMAAAVFLAAAARDAGAVILELARSEQEYTFQRPGEFLTNVLAGAIAAGWSAPVFVQGDHFQFNAAKYAADPETTTEGVRRLAREAVAVGYGNIDIDSSTLVDLGQPTVDAQQRVNYERAAELSALIRAAEPASLTISIGGEIGEVGKENSNEAELRTYLDGYRRELDRVAGPDTIGLSKVSVQTGTSHGGVPLPGGGVADVMLDFSTLERLSMVCREYGLAGAVQHGASTLPDALFHRFPQVETAEVHLATGFQNLLYEHPAFPAALGAEIEAWCVANCALERKAGESDAQFLYKTRKKALGPYKRTLWDLPAKDEIIATQEAKVGFLMDQLAVAGTAEVVARYIRAEARERDAPEGLLAASVAQG